MAATETSKLDTLYNLSDELSKTGVDFTKHEHNFAKIVEYISCSESKEKTLAAQLAARYLKHFPNHAETCLKSTLEMCKSTDIDIRKHAVMSLTAICRAKPDFVDQVAGALIQLYQSDQVSEVNLINASLVTLISLDTKKFFTSFFAKLEDGSEIVRERALKFLTSKIQTLAPELLTREVEELIMALSKKAMEDVTKDEFIYFVAILSKLKLAKTVNGQAMIVESIKAQADLDKDIDVNDADAIDRFLMCTKNSIPLLTQYNRASAYVNYICLKLLPNLSVLAKNGTDLQILQALAEMAPFIVTEDDPAVINLEKCQELVYSKLLDYLPIPSDVSSSPDTEKAPVTAAATTVETTETGADDEEKDEATKTTATTTTTEQQSLPKATSNEPDFQFTHIEYLLYAIHQLCRIRPEFFTETLQNKTRLRLHHLAVGCTKYMELLSNLLKEVKSSEDLKKEENKLRNVALRTTKNISMMVKDLFKKPAQFKTSVLLSCKPLTTRPIDVTSDSSNNQAKKNNNNNSHADNSNKQQIHHKGSNKRPYNGNNNNNNNNNTHHNNNSNRFGGGGQKHKFRSNYQPNKRRRY